MACLFTKSEITHGNSRRFDVSVQELNALQQRYVVDVAGEEAKHDRAHEQDRPGLAEEAASHVGSTQGGNHSCER